MSTATEPQPPVPDTASTDAEPSVHGLYRELLDPVYEWRQKFSARPWLPMAPDDETFSLGFDIKITPWGAPRIVEFHVNEYGTEGFNQAFEHGGITPLRNSGSGGRFTEYMERCERKDRLHDALGHYTAGSIEDTADLDPEQKVVVKSTDRDRGEGVSVSRAEDASAGVLNRFRYGEHQIEPFIGSKDVYHNGEAYDACMRYVMNGRIEDGQLTLEDLGGYWRTAPEPKYSDASLTDRFVANLKRGHAVNAQPYELQMAANTAAQATRDMFDQWLWDEVRNTQPYQ